MTCIIISRMRTGRGATEVFVALEREGRKEITMSVALFLLLLFPKRVLSLREGRRNNATDPSD